MSEAKEHFCFNFISILHIVWIDCRTYRLLQQTVTLTATTGQIFWRALDLYSMGVGGTILLSNTTPGLCIGSSWT